MQQKYMYNSKRDCCPEIKRIRRPGETEGNTPDFGCVRRVTIFRVFIHRFALYFSLVGLDWALLRTICWERKRKKKKRKEKEITRGCACVGVASFIPWVLRVPFGPLGCSLGLLRLDFSFLPFADTTYSVFCTF